jgi:hypothetical protein
MEQAKDSRPPASAPDAEDVPVVRQAVSRVQAAVTLDLTQALSELDASGGPVYIYGPEGKPVAALISVDHARTIEEFEDRQDAALAKQAMDELKKPGEELVPWEVVKAKAGL